MLQQAVRGLRPAAEVTAVPAPEASEHERARDLPVDLGVLQALISTLDAAPRGASRLDCE